MITPEEYLAMLGVVVLSFFAGVYVLLPIAHLVFRPFRKSSVAYFITYMMVIYLFLDMLIYISLVGFGDNEDIVFLIYSFVFVYIFFILVCAIVHFILKIIHPKLMPRPPSKNVAYSHELSDDYPGCLIFISASLMVFFPIGFVILNVLILPGELTNPLTYRILDLLISALENPDTGPVILWAGWIVGGLMIFALIVILVILFL